MYELDTIIMTYMYDKETPPIGVISPVQVNIKPRYVKFRVVLK